MGKHNFLSNEKRIQLINDRENGMKVEDLAKKYKITICCVSKTTKNETKYLSLNKNQLKFKTVPKEKYQKLNEIVVKYIQSANASKVAIDVP